jgi:hypothetical protein
MRNSTALIAAPDQGKIVVRVAAGPKIISTVRAEAATRRERASSLKPKRLAADTAYGTGHFLGWLVGRGIAPHIPVRDASERDDGTFSHSDFRWDRRHGVSICPNNKVLHTTEPRTTATCSATAPPNSTAMLVQDAMLSEYGCPTGTP